MTLLTKLIFLLYFGFLSIPSFAYQKEKLHFPNNKPDKPEELGQQISEDLPGLPFHPSKKDDFVKEFENLYFGSKQKNDQPKDEGQKHEEFNFESLGDHHGPSQQLDSNHFGQGQEYESFNFNEQPPKEKLQFHYPKPIDHGQEYEHFNFGDVSSVTRRPKHTNKNQFNHKGQQHEDFSNVVNSNNYKHDFETGKKLENFNIGQGQQDENFVFGSDSSKNTISTIDEKNKYQLMSFPNEDTQDVTGFRGGCVSRPPVPVNSLLTCSLYSGCKASCQQGHKFPNGDTTIFITCEEGHWKFSGESWEVVPPCRPTCLPSCENNGICIAPNQCQCQKKFSGPQCQFERKPCLNFPSLPANSVRSCTSRSCTISCANGFQFPDGSSITNLHCTEGQWTSSRKDWSAIPDCQPVCHPPCLNGGNCLALDVCQCPQQFTGPQCQYEMNACSGEKLKFNGIHNCSGNGEELTCHIQCPPGISMNATPAAQYTCLYQTGIFEPQPIPSCVYGDNVLVIPVNTNTKTLYLSPQITWGSSHEVSGISNHEKQTYQEIKELFEEIIKPSSGECVTWGGRHFKNFDGGMFSFDIPCEVTLVEDKVDNLFHILIGEPTCKSLNCSRSIRIMYQNDEYKFITKAGSPTLLLNGKEVSMPIQRLGVIVSIISGKTVLVQLTLLDMNIKWTLPDHIIVSVKENMWNRTQGICGTLNKLLTDDFPMKNGVPAHTLEAFVGSWVTDSYLESQCTVITQNPCSQSSQFPNGRCQFLMHPTFAKCRKVLNERPYYDACLWDTCTCNNCTCGTIAEFVRQCKNILSDSNVLMDWREVTDCPHSCMGGQLYTACVPSVIPSCGADQINSLGCEEGCVCPQNMVLHDNICIERDSCPCTLRKKSFPNGAQLPKGCNTCTCQGGNWICTEVRCGARCSSIGDPHYTTFDGKRFDFMGQCSYYLLQTGNLSIEAENVPCSGAISNTMGYLMVSESEMPTCTKTLKISSNGRYLELRQGGNVLVNGENLSKFPYQESELTIQSASSTFIVVTIRSNNVTIWWDGITSVYIDIPSELYGLTKGLCGTFNLNQKDDFLTPEGDIEESVVSFANKWKTSETCKEVEDKVLAHPCEKNPAIKKKALTYCEKLKSKIFEDCHWYVDVSPFYQNCLYDVCSCRSSNIRSCLCPILADYASSCAKEGKYIPWRTEINECGIHCPGGQIYQTCGDNCARSCQDISLFPTCRRQCVEGCNCPEGYTLDALGRCIVISECPCILHNAEYRPGHQLVTDHFQGPQFCTCRNALWDCREATSDESQKYSEIKDIQGKCSRLKNEEFTWCEPAEVVTCKNMHNPPQSTPSKCNPGCVCKNGFVWDSIGKQCVQQDSCPCHHGGKSFETGFVIQQDCNTCACEGGQWNCTNRLCPSICSSWGDTHFETFDGHIYDFQGSCDYLLTGGALSQFETFDIKIEIVPCGTTGASCPKSITVRVGSNSTFEQISFTKSHPSPKVKDSRIFIYHAGLFVFAEILDFGIVLQWDRGTRVYVKADSRWRNKLKGLCGNMNGDVLDDFKTPSGGINEVSPTHFADSWKLQPYCRESTDVTDTCVNHPERRDWAIEKCSFLKSNLFKPCHSEVPLDPYIDKCILDSCACDVGGDCECLCSAIAAYAHKCSIKGIPIKWRSQQFCPLQCDLQNSHYSPCVSACPPKTCTNSQHYNTLMQDCPEQTCIEGCTRTTCPTGEIFSNDSLSECVPINFCKPVCLRVNDVVYFEGDIMDEDNCHTCYCSNNKKMCAGKPCTTEILPPTVSHDGVLNCQPGWTSWINIDHPLEYKKKTDYEPLPTENLLLLAASKAHCNIKDMIDIKCREVDSHKHHKASGLDVECSLERGLICYSTSDICPDYEISVLCQCPNETDMSTPPSPPYTEPVCKENEKWIDCAVPCNQTCHYFGHLLIARGFCKSQHDCLSGCQPLDWEPCSKEFWLRDSNTCVTKNDCTCRSHFGQLVKPGVLNHESSCEKCQCFHNNYECDTSECYGKPTLPPSTTLSTMHDNNLMNVTLPQIIRKDFGNVTLIYLTTPSTVTPPPSCDTNRYQSILQNNKDRRISASSFLNNSTELQNIMISNSTVSWTAGHNNLDQYLQIDFGKEVTIYGIKIAGDPMGHFVTSYRLLYSHDGHSYVYISTPENIHFLFRGPIDGVHPVQQILPTPIEARYLRLNPFTWHGAITLKVDVLGCDHEGSATTPEPAYVLTTPISVPCDDTLLENGKIPLDAITVSSSKLQHGKEELFLTSERSWQPLTNSRLEWIMVHFSGPRNLTGIVTRGQSHGNYLEAFQPEAWIESFQLDYSHDGVFWNTIDKPFLANFDGSNARTNLFNLPIQANYIKFYPLTWHNAIALRMDFLGCYEPYKVVTTTEAVISTTSRPECILCPGVLVSNETECVCKVGDWWDGEDCVTRPQCPCVVGHMSYPVGAVYETSDCQQCICRLNGIPRCESKKCSSCANGLKSHLTSSCACVCKPCEDGTVLCPTSNICIPKAAWCDGVEHCPDDEINCLEIATEGTKTCNVTCPPGFTVQYLNALNEVNIISTKTKSGRKTMGRKDNIKTCLPYDCVPLPTLAPTECSKPICPPKYVAEKVLIKFEENSNACPRYTCNPIPEEAQCSLSGRTFQTFDHTEYKYDICHHILVTDIADHTWSITVSKSCATILTCSLNLVINLGDSKFNFTEGMKVMYDGFEYSNEQIDVLNAKSTNFNLTKLGNFWQFNSIKFGFQVLYGLDNTIQIKVTDKLKGRLSGLCGLYNGITEDDKTDPNGVLSLSTSNFGQSWSVNEHNLCDTKVCSYSLQEKALEYCNTVRSEQFAQCATQYGNIDHFISRCLELTCICLMSNKTNDECRCNAVLNFLMDCKNKDMSQDISGWRVQQSCIASCPLGQIFYDCYPFACEGTCENSHCFEKATSCRSGCFCPDGLLRKGNDCIKPTDCRDCVCDGLGESQYLSFSRKNFTFSGNCSYVAVRDTPPSGVPNFQVIIKNAPCGKSTVCTKEVAIVLRGHSVSVNTLKKNKVTAVIDGSKVTTFPFNSTWLYIEHNTHGPYELSVPAYHLQLSFYPLSHSFTISLPSNLYINRTEGLCGRCTKDQHDDVFVSSRELADLWKVTRDENDCGEVEDECVLTDEQQKLCRRIIDDHLFSKCHSLIDPEPFISLCFRQMCHNTSICEIIDSYAKACRRVDICIDWRTNDFCPMQCALGHEYKVCGLSCTINCENYKMDASTVCPFGKVEGCFCGDHQVAINGTCMSADMCTLCDELGHKLGDIWHVDNCTKCNCTENGKICTTIECRSVETICQENFSPVKVEDLSECCPQYTCVPHPPNVTLNCEEPNKVECGFGQQLELRMDSSGCPQFICRCKDDCEQLQMDEQELPIGMERYVNKSGCCPRIETICNIEKCPPVLTSCPQHHQVIVYPAQECCPRYECELAPNICLIRKETTLKSHEVRVVAKIVGEEWQENACKKCSCIKNVEKNLTEITCTETKCPTLVDHPDFADYVLEAFDNIDECCPQIVRKACKDSLGKIHNPGDSWKPNQTDPCKQYKCFTNENDILTREMYTEWCKTNCDIGWEYEASRDEELCCGKCVQIGCFVDGIFYTRDTEWQSADNCTRFKCIKSQENGFQVISSADTCPNLDDCPVENIYQEGCCPKCNITKILSRSNCLLKNIEATETIGLVTEYQTFHGKCSNNEPLKDFTECIGACDSRSSYNKVTWAHDSVCECCKAGSYKKITVPLVCEDGYIIDKYISVPSICECKGCGL